MLDSYVCALAVKNVIIYVKHKGSFPFTTLLKTAKVTIPGTGLTLGVCCSSQSS